MTSTFGTHLALVCVLALSLNCEKSMPPVAPTPGPDSTMTPDLSSSAPETTTAGPAIAPIDVAGLDRNDLTDLLRGALRVTIGDLTGDGNAEIIVADATRLRVLAPDGTQIAEAPVERAAHVLSVSADSGGAVLVSGWGRSLQHPDATARVSLYRLDRSQLTEEVVIEPETERAEVVSVIARDDDLVVSWFQSKFMVETARATRSEEGWTLTSLDVTRMATSAATGDVDHDGDIDQVIGRVYGDQTSADGDAFLRRDTERIPIPTLRGVRGLAVGDLDRDDKLEVYLGDGWHQNYGAIAEARLSRSSWTGEAFQTEVIAVHDRPGEYTVWEIGVANLGERDGDDALVVRTNLGVFVYVPRAEGWARADLGGPYNTFAIGNIDGESGDELLLAGDQSVAVSLRDLLAR